MNTPLPVLPHAPLGFEDDKPIPAKTLAQRHTAAAIQTLLDVATNSDDDNAKIKAAQALLDRGWGKAEQSMQIQSEQKVIVLPAWAAEERLRYAQAGAEVIEMAGNTYTNPEFNKPAAEPDPQPEPWKPDDATPFVRAARDAERGS